MKCVDGYSWVVIILRGPLFSGTHLRCIVVMFARVVFCLSDVIQFDSSDDQLDHPSISTSTRLKQLSIGYAGVYIIIHSRSILLSRRQCPLTPTFLCLEGYIQAALLETNMYSRVNTPRYLCHTLQRYVYGEPATTVSCCGIRYGRSSGFRTGRWSFIPGRDILLYLTSFRP